MHFLSHWLGLDNASGTTYLFWSGFFGDTVIFAAMLGLYFKHSCHTGHCWRIARHTVDGSPFCTRHLIKGDK